MCTANKINRLPQAFPCSRVRTFYMYVLVLHMHMWYDVLACGLRSNMEAASQTA